MGARPSAIIISFLATFLGAPAMAQSAAPVELRGSVYPTDRVKSITEQDNVEATGTHPIEVNTLSTQSPVLADPELVAALGGAAHLLKASAPQNSFKQKIRLAVGRHPAYHSQLSTLGETKAGSARARSALLPQISSQLSGDYSLTRDFGQNTINVVESLQPRERFNAGVSASQLVFDGGAALQRIKSARARQSEFENAIEARINELAYTALSSYHDLLTHRALIALSADIVRRHQEIFDDVSERERLGAGSMADVTLARARLAAARARASEIRESGRLSAIRYEEFFGEKPEALARPNVADQLNAQRESAVADALANNPELAMVTERSNASRADYRAAKGARLPEVRVSVDATKFDVFDGNDDFDVRAGVNLRYDLYNGGLRGANIAEARSRLRQAEFNEEQIRQEIARDAAIAFEMRVGALERLDVLGEAVIAHNETRDLVLERYRVSRGTLIDVLQTENDYFDAAIAYITGLTSYDLSNYALMVETGELARHYAPREAYDELLRGEDG